MTADGSITLPPNPFGTAATWADFDWRGMADNARSDQGWVSVAGKVFDLIADAIEQDTPECANGNCYCGACVL